MDKHLPPLGRTLIKVFCRWAMIPLALFGFAGTIDWWAGWIVVALAWGWMGYTLQWLLRHNRALLSERVNASFRNSPYAWDRRILYGMFALGLIWLPLSALDAVRFAWSDIPWGLQLCGMGLLLLSLMLMTASLTCNRYLSPLVKVADGAAHKVIQTGPYRWVRHPFYTGICGMSVGLPLSLGSTLGLAVGALMIALVVRRTQLEDRLLHHELPAYAAYADRVRWRLLPHIW